MANPAGSAFTEEELRDLIRAVADATTTHKTRIKCKSCQREYEYSVAFPDKRIQLDAIKFAHENGYGKASPSKDPDTTIPLDIDVTALPTNQRTTLRQTVLATYPTLVSVFSPAPE